MKKIKITKEDLDKDNFFNKEEIGTYKEAENVSVEIDENLGWVRFKKGVYVTGSIVCKAGSGIEAGSGIKAGEGIEAGSGIEAGEGIKAGWGIEAGSGIKAGWGIEAGEGIVSLYSWIKAKLTINFNSSCTISAGIFSLSGEKEIEAEAIEGGKIIYGTVKLLPVEKVEEEKSLSGKEVEVNVDGKIYTAVIK